MADLVRTDPRVPVSKAWSTLMPSVCYLQMRNPSGQPSVQRTGWLHIPMEAEQ
jgi:hypothetical protein